jgi:phage terminase large subunit-like protein
VVTGTTRENEINLSPDFVSELEATFGGTQRGAEELEGTFFDDLEDAMFRSEWIEKSRRSWPEKFKRRVISVDPAITSDPRSSDATGIVDAGLGVDDQIYALRNLTGVHRAETWPGMVIDAYVSGQCDVILCETNRGGNAWSALLRGAAHARGLQLLELGPREEPGHRSGTVYLRCYTSRGQKAVRASAAAALVERGRVSFVHGQLGDLEDRLCNFTGEEGQIDDCVDAFVAACHELAGLAVEKPRYDDFRAVVEMNRRLRSDNPRYQTSKISHSLRKAMWTPPRKI